MLGAFFVSGIMHDFGVWGAGLGTELSSVTFVMMGVRCVGLAREDGCEGAGALGLVIISKMGADAARPALYWVKVAQRWVELHGQPLQ